MSIKYSKLLQELNRWLFATVSSFEFLLVMYLFAGIYKSDSWFNFVPVDITGLLGIVTMVSAAYIVSNRDFNLKISYKGLITIVSYYLLICFAAVSLLWSPSSLPALLKLFEMTILTGWLLIATIIVVVPESQRQKRILISIVLFSFWFAIEAIVTTSFLTPPGEVVAFGGNNYIGLSRGIGAGVIVAGFYYMNGSIPIVRIFSAGITLTGLFAILQTGARGPFLATLFGLSIIVVLSLADRDYTLSARELSLLASIAVIAVMIGSIITPEGIDRFRFLSGIPTVLAEVGTTGRLPPTAVDLVGNSIATRLDYYISALQYWERAPIAGHGLGSFGVLYFGVDNGGYPHNIVLESLVELGLLGTVPLLIVLLYPLIKTAQSILSGQHTPSAVIVFSALVCFGLVNAMISGNLGTNRFMFFATALAVGSSHQFGD